MQDLTLPHVPQTAIEILGFLLLFALAWVATLYWLSQRSGWRSLALRFSARRGDLTGERHAHIVAALGRELGAPVHYQGAISLTLNPAGFGLRAAWPFRPFAPALFVPWQDVEHVLPRVGAFRSLAVVRTEARAVHLRLGGEAGDALRRHHEAWRAGRSAPQ